MKRNERKKRTIKGKKKEGMPNEGSKGEKEGKKRGKSRESFTKNMAFGGLYA